ncbi:hypothetical protein TNCV_2570751 [Trichonephila clavipes]|nr:hypothetical protein TNCV_2570751 [Trichonephila clavipes]
MAAVDFLHLESPQTWAEVESATFGCLDILIERRTLELGSAVRDLVPVVTCYSDKRIDDFGRTQPCQTARKYPDTIDNVRILRAEKTAKDNCKKARTLRRALKAAENDNFERKDFSMHQA